MVRTPSLRISEGGGGVNYSPIIYLEKSHILKFSWRDGVKPPRVLSISVTKQAADVWRAWTQRAPASPLPPH